MVLLASPNQDPFNPGGGIGLVNAAQRRLDVPTGAPVAGSSNISTGVANAGSPVAAGISPFGNGGAVQIGGTSAPGTSAPTALPPAPTGPISTNAIPDVAPQWSGPTAKSFDFNPKYQTLDQGNLRDLADAGLARGQAYHDLIGNYNSELTSGNLQQKTALQRLQDRLASQGIGQSSIAIEQAGNLQQQYQNYLSDLQRKLSSGESNADINYGKAINRVSTNREGLYTQQGDEQAAAAAQAARDAAQAKAASDAAEAQRLANEQQLATQRATLAAVQSRPAPNYGAPSSPGIGGVQWAPDQVYGGTDANMRNLAGQADYMSKIDLSDPKNFVYMMQLRDNDQGLPQQLRDIAMQRIMQYNQAQQGIQGTQRGGRAI